MRPVSHLLLDLITDTPLSAQDRWELAVFILRLLRELHETGRE